ncbi:P22 coat - protein 5 family protein, partial [Pseudomonas aeruginosa]
ATRAPAMPDMGDFSAQFGPPEYVTDPSSGLVFQIVHYGGFRQMTTHVAIAWGYKTVAPRHLGILLG